jgi:hypothetical protein
MSRLLAIGLTFWVATIAWSFCATHNGDPFVGFLPPATRWVAFVFNTLCDAPAIIRSVEAKP